MKWLSRILIIAGILLIGIFGFTLHDQNTRQSVTLEEAQKALEINRAAFAEEKEKTNETDEDKGKESSEDSVEHSDVEFDADYGEILGVLDIPKLGRSIGIMEGSDDDAMKNGVGHVESTVYPGQNEQIVLSGHRETVFRDFGELEIGDRFIVEMTYGTFEYEIKDFKIVDSEDTSVIGKMGEEVLVVSTCYPFSFVGSAPERYVVYAYPVK